MSSMDLSSPDGETCRPIVRSGLMCVGGPMHGQWTDAPGSTYIASQPEMTPWHYDPDAELSPVTKVRRLETTYRRGGYQRVSPHPCVRELVMVERWVAWVAEGRPEDTMMALTIAEVPRESTVVCRQRPNLLPTWHLQP